MALYKNGGLLVHSSHGLFDLTHGPGTATPHLGIYRCTARGDDIEIDGGYRLLRRVTVSTATMLGEPPGSYW